MTSTDAPPELCKVDDISALLQNGSHVQVQRDALLPEVLTRLGDRHTSLTICSPSLSPQSFSALCNFISNLNSHVNELNLSGVSLGDASVIRLFASLAKSRESPSPLVRISMQNVGFQTNGAKKIASIFRDADLGRLEYLDLSNNIANWPGVKAIESAIAARAQAGHRPIEVDLDGNLVIVELLNAVTHGIGAGGALAGGILMAVRAVQLELPLATIASLLVFVGSLFTLMTSSCVYHSCFRYPRTSRQLRKADHCSIFILIAGSYTPFVVCYTLDPPTVCGPLTLIAVWMCATAGIIMSLSSSGSNRTRALFALGMGWLGAFSVRTMVERMQSGALSSVVMGGVIYSVGIVFYLLGKRQPIMHVVWHVAVMLGGGFHYFALWRYVVNG